MYCKYCGEPLFDEQTVCVKCGNTVENSKTDTNQGTYQSFQQPKIHHKGNLNGQNKTAMALLCLFLGAYGAHNFIMGENKKGIVKILSNFLGLGIILAIIDFVKILTDNYTHNPNAYI